MFIGISHVPISPLTYTAETHVSEECSVPQYATVRSAVGRALGMSPVVHRVAED